VILTIDTTHPLNPTDRALLRALLDAQGASPTPAHAPALPVPRLSSAEAVMAAVAGSVRKPDGAIAAARLPVADQPGVSFTESTAEPDPHAG
jgi:hypothetical protein